MAFCSVALYGHIGPGYEQMVMHHGPVCFLAYVGYARTPRKASRDFLHMVWPGELLLA